MLCGESLATRDRRDRHLARHLQELALFVLPSKDDGDSKGEHFTGSASDSSRSASDLGLLTESTTDYLLSKSAPWHNLAGLSPRMGSNTFENKNIKS